MDPTTGSKIRHPLGVVGRISLVVESSPPVRSESHLLPSAIRVSLDGTWPGVPHLSLGPHRPHLVMSATRVGRGGLPTRHPCPIGEIYSQFMDWPVIPGK